MEELFWHGDDVNRMLFVISGGLNYKHSDTGPKTIRVGPGEWACEETLWASHSILSGPFVVSPSGCELIMVIPSALHAVGRADLENSDLIVRYASLFLERFNA